MNTKKNNTITTTDSTANTNTKRRLGVRRAFCASLAAITIGLGVGVLSSASPASAASGVNACFQHKGYTAREMRADFQLYYNNRWNTLGWKNTDYNYGCVYVSVSGIAQNYPARWVLNHYAGGAHYYGEPPAGMYALPGSQYATFGTLDYWCFGTSCPTW